MQHAISSAQSCSLLTTCANTQLAPTTTTNYILPCIRSTVDALSLRASNKAKSSNLLPSLRLHFLCSFFRRLLADLLIVVTRHQTPAANDMPKKSVNGRKLTQRPGSCLTAMRPKTEWPYYLCPRKDRCLFHLP